MSKKAVCEECKRTIRFASLVKSKLTDKLICKRCNNKLGSNKFYSPIKSRENRIINNFNITDLEKQVLLRGKNMKQINSLCSQLRDMSKVRKQKREESKLKKQEKIKEQIEIQKKFLEGLKWETKK